MDSRKYLSLSYKVIWQESVDSCKIPLRESTWSQISDPGGITLLYSVLLVKLTFLEKIETVYTWI